MGHLIVFYGTIKSSFMPFIFVLTICLVKIWRMRKSVEKPDKNCKQCPCFGIYVSWAHQKMSYHHACEVFTSHLLVLGGNWLLSTLYPPASEASREVANLTWRKNQHAPVYGVKELVCL